LGLENNVIDQEEEEKIEWSVYDIIEFKDTQMVSLYGRW
jgi:hypothetical protein